MARSRNQFRFAGMTYHGESFVDVSESASSYAAVYLSHSARSARSPVENFQFLAGLS